MSLNWNELDYVKEMSYLNLLANLDILKQKTYQLLIENFSVNSKFLKNKMVHWAHLISFADILNIVQQTVTDALLAVSYVLGLISGGDSSLYLSV